MQVSVEAGEGLERKLTVQVPAEKIEQEVESRLKSMQGRVKIDGFRPGKVPLKVVKQRYGNDVLREVAGELMQSSFRDAVTQENLQPAGDPKIDMPDVQLGQSLEYTATFEVYPEVKLGPVTDLKLEKLSVEIGATDVDEMIETLRKQRLSWSEAERVSEDGDRITVDFKGTVAGVAFDGGTADNVPVIIGSGSMIPGFEEQLIGLSKEDESVLKVTFPEDYQGESLAGKDAEFAIKVNKIEASVLPELDEEFARAFGAENGSIEQLKTDIKANMVRELNNRVGADLKAKVMDQLITANPIQVPDAIVRQEAQSLKQHAETQQPGNNQPVEAYLEDATRRVKLGMLLAELIKTSGLQVDADKVKQRIATMSSEYDDPGEFVRYYQGNPQLMRSVETLVMEDMVVDWVAEQARVTMVESTFSEVMKPGFAS